MAIIQGKEQGTLGGGLGTSIGTGLSNLIDKKIKDLEKHNAIAKRKKSISEADLPEWFKEIYANDPEGYQVFLKSFDSLPEDKKAEGIHELRVLGGEVEDDRYQLPEEQEDFSEQFPQQDQQQTAQALPQSIMPQTPMGQEQLPGVQAPAEDMGRNESTIPGLNNLIQAGQGMQKEPSSDSSAQSFPDLGHGTKGQPAPAQSVSPAIPAPVKERSASAPTTPKLSTPRYPIKKGLTAAQELAHQDKIAAAQDKITAAQDKESHDEYETITREARGAKKDDMRLDRMETLIKKGNLPSGAWSSFVKTVGKGVFGLGIDLSFLNHADAVEFDKLSKDFLNNIKDVFGGRILETEIENYLKTIPDLSQNDEGKERVIRNMRLMNEGKKIRKEAADKLIKFNGGRRPANLDMLVDEATSARMDKIAEEFKGTMAPEDSNTVWDKLRYVTLLTSNNPARKQNK